eukprot:11279769-Alexandrium_andersonii.AAC.1
MQRRNVSSPGTNRPAPSRTAHIPNTRSAARARSHRATMATGPWLCARQERRAPRAVQRGCSTPGFCRARAELTDAPRAPRERTGSARA